jgi:hypothetical protein
MAPAQLLENTRLADRWRTIFGAPCEGTVSQRVRIPPGKVAPAGSNRSSRGGNEAAEASGVEGHVSDLASMQAVT